MNLRESDGWRRDLQRSWFSALCRVWSSSARATGKSEMVGLAPLDGPLFGLSRSRCLVVGSLNSPAGSDW